MQNIWCKHNLLIDIAPAAEASIRERGADNGVESSTSIRDRDRGVDGPTTLAAV